MENELMPSWRVPWCPGPSHVNAMFIILEYSRGLCSRVQGRSRQLMGIANNGTNRDCFGKSHERKWTNNICGKSTVVYQVLSRHEWLNIHWLTKLWYLKHKKPLELWGAELYRNINLQISSFLSCCWGTIASLLLWEDLWQLQWQVLQGALQWLPVTCRTRVTYLRCYKNRR